MIGGVELGGTKCIVAVANNPQEIVEKKVIFTRDPKSTLKSSLNKFMNCNLLDLSIRLRDYNKDLKNFNLSEYENILVIDYSEMINNENKLFEKLSNFLEVEIKKPNKLYYSWNKDKGCYFNNSSYGVNKSNESFDEKLEKEISKYVNFVNAKNSLDSTTSLFIMKFKRMIRKFYDFKK